MTGDKLMREAFLEQTVAIATVPRELKWFIWQIAIRACASECARIADDFVPLTRPLTSEEDVAQRVCRMYAKVIRARFGLED